MVELGVHAVPTLSNRVVIFRLFFKNRRRGLDGLPELQKQSNLPIDLILALTFFLLLAEFKLSIMQVF